MWEVNVSLVREFLEMENFLVYPLKKRSGKRENPYDLFFINPRVYKREVNFFLDPFSIKAIKQGIIKVLGWHKETFTISILKKLIPPVIWEYPVEKEMKYFQRKNGIKKILILSKISSSSESKKTIMDFLREKRVDHVITFETLFWSLIDKIKKNRNYTSPILEVLRILKIYHMIKSPQLEFFNRNK